MDGKVGAVVIFRSSRKKVLKQSIHGEPHGALISILENFASLGILSSEDFEKLKKKRLKEEQEGSVNHLREKIISAHSEETVRVADEIAGGAGRGRRA